MYVYIDCNCFRIYWGKTRSLIIKENEMTFLLQNWGRASAHANEPIYTLASSVVVGAPRLYQYYTADAQSVVAVANYFCPSAALNVCRDVSVGDTISVYSSADVNVVNYLVTAVDASVPSLSIQAISGILRSVGTITSVQMLAGLYAHPVQLIPAPGANKMIVGINASLALVYNSIQYANGGAVIFQYDSTIHGAGTNLFATTVAASDINGAASGSQLLIGVAQAFNANTFANKAVYLSCATGEFTAGNSTLVYDIAYKIVNLA